MGYEMDKIEKIEIYNKENGEKIGEINPPITCYTEETEALASNDIKIKIPKEATQFTATSILTPPRPNIKMIISPGDQCGNTKTEFYFYRPKYYNWFQRLMYKMCFGITIKQGDEVRHEFL